MLWGLTLALTLILLSRNVQAQQFDQAKFDAALKLSQQAGDLFAAEQYAEALPVAMQARDAIAGVFGANHKFVASQTVFIGSIYQGLKNYDEAVKTYREALAVQEKVLPPNSADTAFTLTLLGRVYERTARYDEAGDVYKRALAIREAQQPQDLEGLGTALNNLGVLYYRQSNYAQALPLLERALSVFEQKDGPESPSVATALNNLAQLYEESRADYRQAEKLLLRALKIRQKALGPDHRDVAATWNNLCGIYRSQAKYQQATSACRAALDINTRTNRLESDSGAVVLSGLGAIAREQGNYQQATTYFEQAIAIHQKLYGAAHPELASTLNGLGLVYHKSGDYERAVSIFQKSLAMKEQFLGPTHPEIATSLNNLALSLEAQYKFAEAEKLLLRALSINEKAYGPTHPEVSTSLLNLSVLAHEMNAPERALDYAQRALRLKEQRFGTGHLETAIPLNNLAAIYDAQHNYDASAPLYRRALAIYEKTYGPTHPDIAILLQNLATGYFARRDVTRTLPLLTRSAALREQTLNALLSVSSETQKRAYLAVLQTETFANVTFHVNYAPNSKDAARLAMTTLLQRKGRALDAMTDQVGALRRRANPQDQALLDELATVRAQLAAPKANDVNETARLTSEAERLETEISRRSLPFRAAAQPVTLEAVSRALPTGSALVEYFVYRPFDPAAQPNRRLGRPQYVAYVLRAGDPAPQFVELGDAASLEDLIKTWRTALQDPKSTNVKGLARQVERRVFLPVRALTGPIRQLFISPDGALNLMPFAALVDENGRYIVENYTLTYLSSGRDVLRWNVSAPQSQPPVVLANPAFSMPPATPALAVPRVDANARRSMDFKGMEFAPLPGTEGEANALRKLLPDAQVVTRQQATEAFLKNVASPRILHIATHGFFLDAPKAEPVSASDDTVRGLGIGLSPTPNVAGENPLLRSGLVLAGVKQQASGAGEDGVLTALEAADLNLWGTRLVVLSACETGLGDVRNGEGVFGLRRALVLAGSETQIMSLWSVSDTATRDLMIGYYGLLQKGAGRSAALREVQLSLLRGTSAANNYAHPYYWAAFIPSGRWTPLQ